MFFWKNQWFSYRKFTNKSQIFSKLYLPMMESNDIFLLLWQQFAGFNSYNNMSWIFFSWNGLTFHEYLCTIILHFLHYSNKLKHQFDWFSKKMLMSHGQFWKKKIKVSKIQLKSWSLSWKKIHVLHSNNCKIQTRLNEMTVIYKWKSCSESTLMGTLQWSFPCSYFAFLNNSHQYIYSRLQSMFAASA